MFFVVVGAIMVAPHIINGLNRVIHEIVIPRQDIRKLQKRRAQQAADGIPESKREVFNHVHLSVELTNEEVKELKRVGALDILARGAHRRPHIRRMEDRQAAA